MTTPDLSIIIPVYNRRDLIRYSLQSVRRAAVGLSVETIVVDDGSEPPVADDLLHLGLEKAQLIDLISGKETGRGDVRESTGQTFKVVRQVNQGLLFARLTGMRHATGKNILFLDSDDLVGPEKFRLQLSAMARTGAEVSYSDFGTCALEGSFDSLQVEVQPGTPATSDPVEFFIRVQPPPHSPIFRTDYLRAVVAGAMFPPSPLYNSVAEIWFYYNASVLPARVIHVPGAHAWVGTHPGVRLTNHWERLGIASLGLLEAFCRSSLVNTAQSKRAKQLAGESAFRAWRALPSDFSIEFSTRLLAVSQRLGMRSKPEIGGPGFGLAAKVLGHIRTAQLTALLRPRKYAVVRTMSDVDFQDQLNRLPVPDPKVESF